jgi:hypothetical protein
MPTVRKIVNPVAGTTDDRRPTTNGHEPVPDESPTNYLSVAQHHGLPRDWAWTTIGEIAEVVRGASPRPKGDPRYFGGNIAWIMISDVTRESGRYISKTRDTVTEQGAERSRYLQKGTLILSNSGTVCVPKILAVDGCIHDGFVAFPGLTNEIDILYIYYHFECIFLCHPSLSSAGSSRRLSSS